MEPPPYVIPYKKIDQLLEKIEKAETPDRFTNQYVSDVLGFKSTNDRGFVGFLKKLGLTDANGVPTEKYRDYRDPQKSKKTLGDCIKQAYVDLYKRDKDAHTLTESVIEGMVKAITGLGDDSQIPTLVAKTFVEIRKHATFADEVIQETLPPIPLLSHRNISKDTNIQFGYTITLNLPVSTNQEVYDVIFKSLKENLLSD